MVRFLLAIRYAITATIGFAKIHRIFFWEQTLTMCVTWFGKEEIQFLQFGQSRHQIACFKSGRYGFAVENSERLLSISLVQ